MNRLKDLRENQDLSQKEVANVLNVDQSTYCKYEKEIVIIPLECLYKLADFYNTSIDYIIYRTDYRKPYKKSIMNTKR